MKKTILLIAAGLSILSCKKTQEFTGVDEENSAGAKYSNSVSNVPYSTNPFLKNANPDVLVGAAINELKFNAASTYTYKSEYINRASLQYNSITAENEMKFKNIQAVEGTFTYGHDITKFAYDYGIKRVHGHALIWYNGVPTWVVNKGGSTTGTARYNIYYNIMKNHIDNVVDHYGDIYNTDGSHRIKSWDVINEVFNDDGTYRTSIWRTELGGGYPHVKLAFQLARMAAQANGDTDLKLFYNDYGHEYSKAKTDAIFAMVNMLKDPTNNINGQPLIDGVGLQFHMNYNTKMGDVPLNSGGIEYAIRKMRDTGRLVHIAELDVSTYHATAGGDLTFRRAERDKRYNYVPQIYRALVPDAQRWGITLWNVGDSDSWLQGEEATLYAGSTYNRKSAYEQFYKGLSDNLTVVTH